MNVYAVIISYNPDIEQLTRLCRTLDGADANVVVVDNSERPVPAGQLPSPCTLIGMGHNTGVAHAQNVGIAEALSRGADVVVLFDHDSRPDDNFLRSLLAGVDPKVPSVVAPVCVDDRTHEELPSFRLSWLGLPRKVTSRGRQESYRTDLVIASGSAATAPAFLVAGSMDEDLFIDFVDFEWCMRCRSGGVPVTVVPRARLFHSIGSGVVRFGVIGGSLHSASRSYYKMRNCLLLFRKSSVPTMYALISTLHAFAVGVLMLTVVKEKFEYAKILALAIRHGIAGVRGANPLSVG